MGRAKQDEVDVASTDDQQPEFYLRLHQLLQKRSGELRPGWVLVVREFAAVELGLEGGLGIWGGVLGQCVQHPDHIVSTIRDKHKFYRAMPNGGIE
jgi:hypothetical protein